MLMIFTQSISSSSTAYIKVFMIFSINTLLLYYGNIYDNATIDYHDYNLALDLHQSNIPINFISETCGTIIINNYTYADYQNNWVGSLFRILL